MSSHHNDHFLMARKLWQNTQSVKSGERIIVTGFDLDISTVVAVSRGQCQPHLTENEKTVARIHDSVEQLNSYLSHGNSVYGVNTGFGGSADTRTNETNKLQIALLQLTQSGVLLESDKSNLNYPSENHTEQNSMPTSWVRAAMLVRCNATARGHSAVTMDVLQTILQLLRQDITPVVPLRGSISASGDLMPLSYIAGAIEGNPDIVVRRRRGSQVTIMGANEALMQENIPKIKFGPKDALGLVNGTASSAALGALVMYDAHHLATLSQAITAMVVESLNGNSESFHPFIAQVRPHPGQIEVSRNILALLKGSSFAKGMKGIKDRNPSGLAQDRYALRSTPQWIGPQLEDLLSAHVQITTELNSSADNPLVDVETKEVYTGANFQAAAVTAAMEKTRLALQMLGRLLFAQSTEMIDPTLNNGLPANLAADDPSTSFTMKGVDINMAAYMSELAFLTNPVSSHVQTAEMHNQSINSLALVSARMTKKAVEIVSLMSATCLYVGFQALDLRAMQTDFLYELQPAVKMVNESFLASYLTNMELQQLNSDLDRVIAESWKGASRLDIIDRSKAIGDAATLSLLRNLNAASQKMIKPEVLSILDIWRQEIEKEVAAIYQSVTQRFFKKPSTESYIGLGSLALYRKIRYELGVPFHQGLAEHPGTEDGVIYGDVKRPRKIVGSWISIIYQALLDGRIYDALYNGVGDEICIVKGNEHANGVVNGHANGVANGHANGVANGHTNGVANGHANGSGKD